MARISKDQQQEARARLAEIFPKGSSVYVIIRRTTRTNLAAYISVYASHADLGMWDVTGKYAHAMGYDTNNDNEYKLDGLGTDRAFSVTYDIDRMCGRDGYQLKPRYL